MAERAETSTGHPKPKPQNKLIYLVRHAQGFHNLKYKNHAMHDPLLTPKGIRQCEDLAASFPAAEADAIDLIVTSPLRRAVYTALHCFPRVIERGVKVVVLPEAQETGAGTKPCDTGSDPDVLRAEFAASDVDLGLVLDGWNVTVEQKATVEELQERALFVRRWLRGRREDVICLISHGGFLHYLTEDFDGFEDTRGTGWANCEWRRYEFKTSLDENASLIRC